MAVQFKLGRYVASWSDGKLADYLLSVFFYGCLKKQAQQVVEKQSDKKRKVFIVFTRTSFRLVLEQAAQQAHQLNTE